MDFSSIVSQYGSVALICLVVVALVIAIFRRKSSGRTDPAAPYGQNDYERALRRGHDARTKAENDIETRYPD